MTEKNKNIDQLINESFQSTDFDFDNSSWENVKDKLDASTTVDKVVYSALNPTDSQLPDSAWENMNDALDIETVWKRLEKRPKRKRFIFWWKIAAIAILLFLITDQSNNNFLEGNTNNYIADGEISNNLTVSEIVKQEHKSLQDNSNIVEFLSKNNTITYSNIEPDQTFITSKSESIIGIETLGDINNFETEIVKIKPKNIKHIETNRDILVGGLINDLDPLIFSPNISRLTIGIVGEIDNTWILDVETRLGYSKNSLVYNDFSIMPSYGVYLDYKIRPNLTICSEVFVNSIMQTKNNLYINGGLTKKETNLEYIKSTFSISKGININKLKKESYLQFSGGVYFSYLKRSFVKYDNVITKINSDYKLFDYGLRLGISYNFCFNRINLSYGLQTAYGLNNVFNGGNMPSYLNNTRNISYGVNLKLGYRL